MKDPTQKAHFYRSTLKDALPFIPRVSNVLLIFCVMYNSNLSFERNLIRIFDYVVFPCRDLKRLRIFWLARKFKEVSTFKTWCNFLWRKIDFIGLILKPFFYLLICSQFAQKNWQPRSNFFSKMLLCIMFSLQILWFLTSKWIFVYPKIRIFAWRKQKLRCFHFLLRGIH